MTRLPFPRIFLMKMLLQGVVFGMLVMQPVQSSAQLGGRAGAYSRMGFGARGMGMGNALTAVTTGEAVGYYNPAALPFAQYRNISASFGILTLDRRLNFLSFTQPLGPASSQNETAATSAARPRAGIAIGIINGGVTTIDGRDRDGEPTGLLQTAENQATLSFGTSLKSSLAVGITIKYLYHHLYTSVNSSTFGFDLGVLYPVSERLTLGAMARDLSSKYTWDTKAIYTEAATTTTDRFPRLYTVGAAYQLPDTLGTVAVDVEFSDQSTVVVKMGAEVIVMPELVLRAGIDRIDVKRRGNGVRPTFGLSARQDFDTWTPALNYAFVIEPFASSAMHIISISVIF